MALISSWQGVDGGVLISKEFSFHSLQVLVTSQNAKRLLNRTRKSSRDVVTKMRPRTESVEQVFSSQVPRIVL